MTALHFSQCLLVARLRPELPKVRVAFLTIKPNPSGIGQLPLQQQAKALIATRAEALSVDFIAWTSSKCRHNDARRWRSVTRGAVP